MARKGLGKKLGIGCLGVLLVAAGIIAFSEPGKALQDVWRSGALQAKVMPASERTYDPSSEGNLKAIHTALLLYHDSEEKFPEANGWMDAIKERIRADDMSQEESQKKLIRPDLLSKDGQSGYALNTKAGGKYKDDVGNAQTILVYESKQTARNAAGDPATDRDGYAITIDGTVLKP